jgi:two-component system, chemotaxis family, chemotaxis protein CheY
MPFRAFNALVVDDCVYMRAIIGTILRGVGLTRIKDANDGAEALAELQIAQYDFILTDISMPTLDGIELAQMVRTAPDSTHPRTPILLITAHTERSRLVAARDAGVNHIVSKPLSARTLIKRMADIVDNPRSFVKARNYVGPCRRRRAPAANAPRRRSEDQNADAA